MFKISENSLAFDGGRSDQLSYQTAQTLLGLPKKYKVMEIIYAQNSIFTHHCIFTLTGAHYRKITLNGVRIEQNKVYEAYKSDILEFTLLEIGFRLYLMASSFNQSRLGCHRGRFDKYFTPANNTIRLIKGPEFSYLNNPKEFLKGAFVISANSDLAGLRLVSLEGKKIQAEQYDIVSSIVDDGLIQLSSNGPIILLSQRQVTGGYPRIFSVIKTDLNFLVQYRIGAVVRFSLIELAVAKNLLLLREKEMENFKRCTTANSPSI